MHHHQYRLAELCTSFHNYPALVLCRNKVELEVRFDKVHWITRNFKDTQIVTHFVSRNSYPGCICDISGKRIFFLRISFNIECFILNLQFAQGYCIKVHSFCLLFKASKYFWYFRSYLQKKSKSLHLKQKCFRYNNTEYLTLNVPIPDKVKKLN